MAQRFFHKVEPQISITLPSGSPWKNWIVVDHANGVIAPQSDMLAEALLICAKQGVGGVTEISKADYDEWLKKKVNRLPRRWRDEWAHKAPSGEPLAKPQSTEPNPSEAAPVVVVNTTRPEAADE